MPWARATENEGETVAGLGFHVILPADRAPRESRWPQTTAEKLFNHDTPTTGLVCAIVNVEPGGHVPLHYHAVETIEYVTTGRAEVKDQHGNAVVVTAESTLHFPAGRAAAHEWTVLGNSPLQVIFFYAAPPGQNDGLARFAP